MLPFKRNSLAERFHGTIYFFSNLRNDIGNFGQFLEGRVKHNHIGRLDFDDKHQGHSVSKH